MTTTLGSTDLDVFPLCLGGNVFGWTADEATSFAVLDAYVEAGGNFVDTANQYSYWAPGNHGGESETILGAWMTARGNRDEIVLATKVGGQMPGLPHDLRPSTIQRSIDESLTRLQTDRIDLYYAHFDDATTPLQETLAAYTELVHAGKVRHLAASNYTAPRLAEALAVSEREGLEAFKVLQPHYNLVERDFEQALEPLCEEQGIPALPYFSLAKGFLTGKYRGDGPNGDSPRAADAAAYADARGVAVLAALDHIATAHGAAVATVALAWLLAKPAVAAPIASARNLDQLGALLAVTSLELSADEVAQLDAASA
jgi:aryl-alcohol dehydrogenase-like predicted oxidoreductase